MQSRSDLEPRGTSAPLLCASGSSINLGREYNKLAAPPAVDRFNPGNVKKKRKKFVLAPSDPLSYTDDMYTRGEILRTNIAHAV